ncbi:MAG: hypothetical protein R6T85_03795 [Egibacteraceae bacterium]
MGLLEDRRQPLAVGGQRRAQPLGRGGGVEVVVEGRGRDGAVRGGGTVTVEGVDGRVRFRVGEGEPIPGA